MAMNTTSTRSAYSHAAAVGLAFVVALTVSALLTPTPSAASGAWIDTFDRQAVIAHHDAAFSGAVPDHGWTGDLSTCSAGTTSPEYRSAIIDRVNWYRAMAGLGPITEDVERSADAQEAAVMNSVQPQGSTLSHDRAVTANFACSTPAASEAAAHSNLARGVSGPTAINSYIRDRGESNTSVGHRNWILSASAEQFGVGDMPKVGDNRATNVLWVDEESDRNPAGTRDGFIAWPNPGFVPNTSVYPRWSFALPRPAEGLDVTEAEVTMQRIDTGRFIDAPIIYRGHNGGAPVDVIVWEPTLDFTGDAGSLPRPALDTTYRITISNIVTQAGATVSYSFDTTVIGTWTLTRALLPLLSASARGRIVNVSSGAGSHGDRAFGLTTDNAMGPGYGIAKAALNALTARLAHEHAASGLKINAVCPGFTATFDGGAEMGARPVEEGAASVVWAAVLDDDGPNGGFFRDGEPLPW